MKDYLKDAVLLTDESDIGIITGSLVERNSDFRQIIQDLQEAEEELDKEIRISVSDHHEDLLNQASGIEFLETHLSMMRSSMNEIVSSAERLKAQIDAPYQKIQNSTNSMEKIQKTSHLLRRISRIILLQDKLQDQINQTDLIKAAHTLTEISDVWSSDLQGIKSVEHCEKNIVKAKKDIERNAESLLNSGLSSQNQTQIGNAVQIFYNLGILESTILENVLKSYIKEANSKVNHFLDVKKISSSLTSKTGSVSGNKAAFRAVLWTNIETLSEYLYSKSAEMIHLQRILCKKKDGHEPFIQAFPVNSANIVSSFWKPLLDTIKKEMIASSGVSNFIKQAFEGEYPKLLKSFQDLWIRLNDYYEAYKLPPEEISLNLSSPFASKDSIRLILNQFEQSYLARSLSRLFDPINLMFSSDGTLPSSKELGDIFKTFSAEMSVVKFDDVLNGFVNKNVSKTIVLFCTKCEQALVTDGDASQVIGYPTEGQKTNVAIVNLLYSFRKGVESVEIPNVEESLSAIDIQVKSAIDPLLLSIGEAVEAIILTLHADIAKLDGRPESCSLYMKELKAFISRVSIDYLKDFECKEFLEMTLSPLVFKIIDVFIVQVSLIRFLNENSKKRLASDCVQLESTLESLKGKENHFARIKAFKSMLFMTPEDIEKKVLSGELNLPASVVLHHLFSAAPPELMTPAENSQWSLSRYSRWLEDHPEEKDRLQLIQGALEKYVASTRQRNEKSYAYPYNIMLSVLQYAMEK